MADDSKHAYSRGESGDGGGDAGRSPSLVRRFVGRCVNVGLSRESANALAERSKHDPVIHKYLTLAALCDLTPAEAIARVVLEEGGKCDRLLRAGLGAGLEDRQIAGRILREWQMAAPPDEATADRSLGHHAWYDLETRIADALAARSGSTVR